MNNGDGNFDNFGIKVYLDENWENFYEFLMFWILLRLLLLLN